MRLTRRGRGVVALVGFCLLMAVGYGARSLNAIVAPLVLVSLAAAVSVARTDEPTIRRQPVADGFVGDRRTVGLDVDVDRPTAAVVRDAVGDGLSATDEAIETTLEADTPVTYEVRLEDRGEHVVGPATVTVTDVLGIVERTFEYRETTDALVYPDVHDLRSAAARDLDLLADAVQQRHREEFSHLREYERGDTLRDVDWKATAKRPDDEPIVKEFVTDERTGTVEIVAEARPGGADEMASAAASVATYLLWRGVAVGITAPNGRREPRLDRDHHDAMLGLLARTGAGEDHADRAEADVLVRATERGATVVVDDHEIPFDRLHHRARHVDDRIDPDEVWTAEAAA